MAIADRQYDALVAARLRPSIESGDWCELTKTLSQLSNAQYRTAGNMLGGKLSASMCEERFWQLFTALVVFDTKAFLGTMLKQVCSRVQNHSLGLQSSHAIAALQSLRTNSIDVQKTLLALLPLIKTPQMVEALFDHLGMKDYEQRIPILLRVSTLPTSYVLFRTLKYEEHNRPLLIRTTHFLMHRGDSLSFNLASLLQCFFALDEVKGTFSLRLQPYQLARLEENYQAFADTLG